MTEHDGGQSTIPPEASTLKSERRSHGIDVLRGISILSVILLHIDIRIPFAKSEFGTHLPHAVSRVLFRNGYYGVKVFFVISGFLITTNILRRWNSLNHVDLKTFYRLRFARIAPCLLALLAVLAVLHSANRSGFVIDSTQTTLARSIFAALTFHLNWLEIWTGYLPANWDVLWSLSVEEVFYIAYPLLCRFSPNRWMLALLGLALVAAGPFARTTWAGGNELAEDKAYLTGFDCIALGCASAIASAACALSANQRRMLRWIGVFFMLQVSVYSFVPGLRLGQLGLDVTVLALGVALFLLALEPGAPNTVWTGPLAWFGRNSYETYLTHSFVMISGAHVFYSLGANLNTAPAWHLGMIAISGGLGWAVARYFSEPLNQRLRQARFSF